MIGVFHKMFMAKDGTKFHIAEIWCGVVWLGETLVTGNGRFPLSPRRLKGSRGQQWEWYLTDISAEDACVSSGLHIVTPFLGSLWTCIVAFFSALIHGLS